jgi:hypothetical protein
MRSVALVVIFALVSTAAADKRRDDARAKRAAKHTAEVNELAEILKPGGHPSLDPALLAKYKPAARWDAHRAWLREVRQHRQEVTIIGEAAENSDIAEFMKRVAADRLFRDVTIVSAERKHSRADDVDYMRFELHLTSVVASADAPDTITKSW